MTKSFVIGIAGASGSGKTTLADAIAAMSPANVSILRHDSYYHDRSRLPVDERGGINFDALEAIESSLYVEHLQQLVSGQTVTAPRYDFSTHTRGEAGDHIEAAPVIIAEGIMVLAEPTIRERLDLRIFMDTDPDVCLLRRVKRDISERGRTISSVMDQYTQAVKPFFENVIGPSRGFADITVKTQDFARVTSAIRRLAGLG